MKIILTFIFLCLVFVNYGYSSDIPKKYLEKNYVFKHEKKLKWLEKTGNWGKPETHGLISQNSWNLRYETKIVRDGKYSLRFEMRDGDCSKEDCPRGKKIGSMGRSEVGFFKPLNKKYKGDHGEVWYAWSMYLPKDTNHIDEAWTLTGQFKELGGSKYRNKKYPSCKDPGEEVGLRLGFRIKEEGLTLFRETCYIRENGKVPEYSVEEQIIIPTIELNKKKNNWLDFLMHVNWSFEKDGFINLWVNEDKLYEHKGINSSIPVAHKGKNPGVAFRFGIYNGNRFDPVKPQVLYYDSFKRGLTCKKTALWHDCNNLPSYKLKIEGKYLLSWYWLNIEKKTNKIISDQFIVSDLINFEKGKYFYDKVGLSNIISDKHRKKIKIQQRRDDLIVIDGKLDLDTDDTSHVTIILKANGGLFEGMGIFDSSDKKVENIKIVLAPLN